MMGRRIKTQTDEAPTVPIGKKKKADQRYRERYAESPTPAGGCKQTRRQAAAENGRHFWCHRLNRPIIAIAIIEEPQ